MDYRFDRFRLAAPGWADLRTGPVGQPVAQARPGGLSQGIEPPDDLRMSCRDISGLGGIVLEAAHDDPLHEGRESGI